MLELPTGVDKSLAQIGAKHGAESQVEVNLCAVEEVVQRHVYSLDASEDWAVHLDFTDHGHQRGQRVDDPAGVQKYKQEAEDEADGAEVSQGGQLQEVVLHLHLQVAALVHWVPHHAGGGEEEADGHDDHGEDQLHRVVHGRPGPIFPVLEVLRELLNGPGIAYVR